LSYVSRSRIAGTTLTVLSIAVGRESLADQAAALAEQVATSPGFYRGAPVLLNVTAATQMSAADDFMALKRMAEELGMVPVGVQGGSADQREAAQAAGLPAFPTGASAGLRAERARQGGGSEPRPAEPPPPQPLAVTGEGARTRLVAQNVRSGAQIYAKGTDLIVLGAVAAGAEVIADGHVHIYGPLRGRAIAGASGDKEARIFCRALDAELIAVAGRYMVHDDIPGSVRGKPVGVMLEDERLAIRET